MIQAIKLIAIISALSRLYNSFTRLIKHMELYFLDSLIYIELEYFRKDNKNQYKLYL